MNHIMLDLETMGNASDAAIIAIGAVRFDPVKKQIVDRFYSRVDLQSCLDVGLTISGSTVMWWLQQSEEARTQYKGVLPAIGIALTGFTHFAKKMPGDNRVWGNGATFDNVILTNAYRAIKQERPWGYRDDRCYRTVKASFPSVAMPQGLGLTAHRADHDAEFQAIHLMDIWPLLKQSKSSATSFAVPSPQDVAGNVNAYE